MPTERAQSYDHLRTAPELSCDLVMKGGITSGVVYPRAIIELASKYRVRSVGGSSAGAIAAGFAAAAEYGRAEDGYAKLAEVADEVPTVLLKLFQPTPRLRPAFELALSVLQSKEKNAAAFAAALPILLHGYGDATAWGALYGGGVGALIGWGVVSLSGWIGSLVIPIVVGLVVGILVAHALRLKTLLATDLPAQFFGICPGSTQPGGEGPGLTDWLAKKLDHLANLGPNDGPLTFGHLRKNHGSSEPIVLEMLTTSLSEGRPYRIPFETRRFFFKASEFRELFPKNVVDWLVSHSEASTHDEDIRHLPDPDDLPVVLAVRMSLSFPVLLSTIPLYAVDYTLRDPAARHEFQRLIFSDGGICSNLPLHFFDSPLPTRPTFAINLEEHDPARHGDEFVALPQTPNKGIARTVNGITTMPGFLGSIMEAMQNWQDLLRLQQPGTRERVATIRLSAGEGGLNLAMSEEQVATLVSRGGAAGELLREKFDFEAHRWRRYLVWSGALEDALRKQHTSYVGPADYQQFIATYPPTEYAPPSMVWRRDTSERTAQLMNMVGVQNAEPPSQGALRGFTDDNAPRPRPMPVLSLLPKQ